MEDSNYEQLVFEDEVLKRLIAEAKKSEADSGILVPLDAIILWIINQDAQNDSLIDASEAPNALDDSITIILHASKLGKLIGRREIIENAAREAIRIRDSR